MKWTKIIIFCGLISILSCRKMEIKPTLPSTTQNIFSLSESKVVNGQSIYFDLPSDGTYTLSLIDKESGQIVSKEKVNSKKGENIKKIYTNSIQSQYLYLLLEDVTKNQLGKTLIKNN